MLQNGFVKGNFQTVSCASGTTEKLDLLKEIGKV